jgi:hypothetical protein
VGVAGGGWSDADAYRGCGVWGVVHEVSQDSMLAEGCPAGRAHRAWGRRLHAFLTGLGRMNSRGPAVGRLIDFSASPRCETGIHATKWPPHA